MRVAHDHTGSLYADAGHPEAYRGMFVDAPHSFGSTMQQAAWSWLDEIVGAR